MITYILRRLLYMLPTIFVPLVLVFLLLRLAPGDPAAQILGDQATPEQISALRHQLGLDQPLLIQFVIWLKGVLTLQLGDSLFFHQPVLEVIPAYAVVTVQIAALALLIAIIIGLIAGVLAAIRRDSILDRGLVAMAVLGISLPEFWLALLLIFVFAVTLRWFPVAGYVPPTEGLLACASTIALPALALGIRQSALITRMTRSAMLEVLDEPYITTARAQGLPEATVIRRYALRMASIPVVTVAGLAASYLLSGVVAIELIFSIPGMGKLLVDAVARRDYPVVEGVVLTISVMLAFLNLLIDLLYAVLDPRIRLK
ncbi:MAG: ABC transporter permease [Verrucomicrobia bacterium]|nr:ABC transporter permease [Verrucomicrobiota bacterium]